MNRYELNKEQRILYASTKKEPFFVDVPIMNYLAFDGTGHPSEEDYQVACEALYTLSYIIKFEIAKKELDIDYKVSHMEVTWYLDKSRQQTEYTWTMMIMQPDFIKKEMITAAMVIAKKKGKKIAYDRVSYKCIDFGMCVQCFHLGDYNKMNDTLAKMKDFAKRHDLDSDQYTHDIYLNDMRKTKVENYKTIMRIATFQKQ